MVNLIKGDGLEPADYTPTLWLLYGLIIAEAVVLALGLVIGIDPVGQGKATRMVNSLLGRGEIRSETWLLTARLMLPVIALTMVGLFAARKEAIVERDLRRGWRR